MGSLKALQEWCRVQCEGYHDVDIKNMSVSFRDGLAFCALIHKHRPDLIDFDSLSKENVYENNRLAFEVAETELGIPALLDADDMVSMKVPDRLSIITYVSQYYNYFTNKSQANPPCMKRPGSSGHIEPTIKKPPIPLEDKAVTSEPNADSESKRSNLSSTCAACEKHVHLVQRFLVDGKLYHRNCFRCTECSSTLLPGSYKLVGDAGSLVCTHHFTRIFSNSQNGRPDLSKQLSPVSSNASPESPPSGGSLEKALPGRDANEHTTPSDNSPKTHSLEREIRPNEKGGEEIREEFEDSAKEQIEPCPPSLPNPFDESDEEELKEEEQPQQATEVANGVIPLTPVRSTAGENRPIPAPRKVSDPSPSVRPVPRPRPPRPLQSPAVSENEGDRRPVPRERSQSPASSVQSSDTPKPKDPPWLALVKQESKKKLAPPPPRPVAAPPHSTSTPAKIEEAPRPATPPNPFDDDNSEGAEAESAEAPVPSSVVAVHPWYGISQTAEVNAESPTRSESPGSGRSKKRPAPRAPKSVPTALPPSQSSSACPSPALSTESLSSSSSDHGFPRTAATAAASQQLSITEQEHPFTKSVSEPSINSPGSSPSALSSEPKSHLSPSPSSSSQPHSNTCSAPATPETNRSAGSKALRPPPPRPPAAPSPLIGSSSSQQNTPNKRVNPFNRKASPAVTSPQSRPPKGPRPARPPAPGHGFPLIKRKVQSDQYIPVEDIHVEMGTLESQLDELEQRGVELEQRLRDCPNEEEEERLLVDWFTLIHEKHLLVRREAELVYTVKQQHLEERQADVEYELRCLLNKPEKEWNDEDRDREKQLMGELVTIIEQRNQIINSMDQDRQREEEEDKLVAAMLKKKEFHAESEHRKKPGKFKPMKVLKRLSNKGDVAKSPSPQKEKS
ncbi:hypothetical protein PDJAM_G00112150 [Pangasius djambal]|uniref:Uncharacterized protein n=1 Tax=Pangasius djambal TaxID=1691987 RepID=A0ACC5Y2W7_9TELE|nr:hypothetical protein [Pangasius djambal]